VASSGEPEYDGQKVTEASRTSFSSHLIPGRFRQDTYRLLICADKFQTGYGEPLLRMMSVDKSLSGIKTVQTLSRLNRAHPQKHDTCVLNFMNDSDTIWAAFDDYYRTTILSDETDPNKLHDLKADLDGSQVYSHDQVNQFATLSSTIKPCSGCSSSCWRTTPNYLNSSATTRPSRSGSRSVPSRNGCDAMDWSPSIQRGAVEYSLAWRRMKIVGKPYEGEPHVRFEVAGGGKQDFGPRRHSLTLPMSSPLSSRACLRAC
jgi:hypothetical protein